MKDLIAWAKNCKSFGTEDFTKLAGMADAMEQQSAEIARLREQLAAIELQVEKLREALTQAQYCFEEDGQLMQIYTVTCAAMGEALSQSPSLSELSKQQEPVAIVGNVVGVTQLGSEFETRFRNIRPLFPLEEIPDGYLYHHSNIPQPAAVPDEVRELIREVRAHGDTRLATLAIVADSTLSAAPIPPSREAKEAERRSALLKEPHLINDNYTRIRAERTLADDDPEYDLFAWGWKAAIDTAMSASKEASLATAEKVKEEAARVASRLYAEARADEIATTIRAIDVRKLLEGE